MSLEENNDKIQHLMAQLEALGCKVIVWVPEDFPGAAPERQQELFDENIKYVVDICIERGNEAISDLCPNEEESE